MQVRFKVPNESLLHATDWHEDDLESLDQFATPLTIYKPDDPGLYRDTDFRLKDGTLTRDHYRFAWRKMVDNSGTRTLIGAIIPPGGGLGAC